MQKLQMADDIDFNDALDNIVLREELARKESYKEGIKAGSEAGNPEGYHLGYHRGAELGRELGFYLGIIKYHLDKEAEYSEKTIKQLEKVKELIEAFPQTNSEDDDIFNMAETIRAQYKKASLSMERKIFKLKNHIDSIIAYLKPYLPLANCHMVEFITDTHWEKLLPSELRYYLDKCDFQDSVTQFWNIHSNEACGNNELAKWINEARNNCVSANNDYCLNVTGLEEKITLWGGELKSEIQISQFMTSKKSYEVQRMSRLVAALSSASRCSHCVEVGGGRAPLPAALALAYHQPVLTIDCNEPAINTARQRIKIIQKQWHAIAKRLNNETQEFIPQNNSKDLNRFVSAFVSRDTDLVGLVKENFPEHANDDVKLLLTGLHTCGNLGPDSLRLFTDRLDIGSVFNTPCCYHLLTEEVDVDMFDVFQKNYGQDRSGEHGFPMSEHMRGYNLGRNARMLAAQSVDRVVHQRQLPSKSLLYRATLQTIIREKSPRIKVSEGKLKGLAEKCQNFIDYFKMADKLLKLDIYDSLSEDDFRQIQEIMSCQSEKIVLFYLVRMCLAQVIESIILLDRLMYLFENGFTNAYLVKLFDPVLSPRCHSIVAIRKAI